MKAPEQLETERLLLRRPIEADAPTIFHRYAGDPEVTRYLGWPRHLTVDDSLGFLQFSDGEWQRAPAGPYLICDRRDGAVLGSTGLAFESPHVAATGYVLAKDAWGKGLATESVLALVELAPQLGIRRLHALCHVDHGASSRVLEKAGFHLDQRLVDHTVFPNLDAEKPLDALLYARCFEG